MYKVSCLVPVYKVERYIERCARSLFEQTYPNLEFIFIDDKTPDDSIAILKKVISEYPEREKSCSIISHDKNRGLAAARNTAIDNASGEFLTHIDSDDWIEKNAIELLVKKQLKTGADIVTGNAIMHSTDGVEFLTHPVSESKQEMILLLFMDTYDHMIWSRLIRRSLYEPGKVRCIEGADVAEDRLQITQLAYFASSFAQADSFVYNYERRNVHSIMTQQGKGSGLRKMYQELINWGEIKDFFHDKEPVFADESARRTVLLADSISRLAAKRCKPYLFHQANRIIDNSDESIWPLIDWSATGFKGYSRHSFLYRMSSEQTKRAIRFIKENFSRTVCLTAIFLSLS